MTGTLFVGNRKYPVVIKEKGDIIEVEVPAMSIKGFGTNKEYAFESLCKNLIETITYTTF